MYERLKEFQHLEEIDDQEQKVHLKLGNNANE